MPVGHVSGGHFLVRLPRTNKKGGQLPDRPSVLTYVGVWD
jgi:hypothetical protein